MPVGLLAGIAVGIGRHRALDASSLGTRRTVTADGGFGPTVVVDLAASYVYIVSGVPVELVSDAGHVTAGIMYLALCLIDYNGSHQAEPVVS